MQTVYRIVDSAAAANVSVILNPAPVGDLSLARIAGGITYLIPNETEASGGLVVIPRDSRRSVGVEAERRNSVSGAGESLLAGPHAGRTADQTDLSNC
jgi:hypothetical protein